MTPKRKPALPRAVRELLRDVVVSDFIEHAEGVGTTDAMYERWIARGGVRDCAKRAARILGTTPGDIVAKARKAGRK